MIVVSSYYTYDIVLISSPIPLGSTKYVLERQVNVRVQCARIIK